MAVDESFKRPGSIPFKWEVQPGIPKQEELPPAAAGDSTAAPAPAPAPGLPPTTPKLALPPAARVSALASSSASCRRSSASVSSAPLSPPTTPTLPPPSSQHHHRRSMSARFATSLALPFTRRPRRGRAAKDDVDYCQLYSEKIA
ncbi:hypothetical protein SEVIR_9G018500v4 [Setaria viridis]|uniref:Uncharacterized protein n=1 Tax=Setaria viridis TaxID=4556 RepID=A0A4U6SR73_SETVI|nr:leucine-rich repeat extensin-like protein 5 [Setaria viridis]TKV90283.1 hypothetical protein SEVIR_9G018500v2 [Setaria viridis]